ncbi:MAG: NTP transferase domain-containing protein [bacterium]|nr:NTP transferase domain-containing protein [bacterium]
MQAIIFAGGKSTRTLPLTVNKPKPLLKVANRTILEHNLAQLKGIASEVIVISGFRGDLITKYNVKFVKQAKPLGTANALLQAESIAKERFIVLNGDDLYSRNDLKKCIKHKYCVLTRKVTNPESFGIVSVNNHVLKITEKPKGSESNLANTGCYVLGKEIFSIIKGLKKSVRGEYELTDAVNLLAKQERIAVEKSQTWIPITHPWSLLDANEALLKGIKNHIRGKVEKNTTLKGAVVVGKNTIIKSGAYIEGPVIIGENCTIGPNCFIRASTTIGNNCRVGNGVEVKNSVIMDNTCIGHLTYIGDSVIGENVNFGAGTVVANLRHDKEDVKSTVNGKLIHTGRRKLGTIVGDNVSLGIHTTIFPGRKIWPNKTTHPAEIVRKDIN